MRQMISIVLLLALSWVSVFGQSSGQVTGGQPPVRMPQRTPTADQQRPRDQQQPQNKQQQRSNQDDDVVKISVTLVQVDAVVTDKNGKQVTDLKPEDFEIIEDKKPQPISNFAYISVNSTPPATLAPVANAGNKSKAKVMTPPPSPRLRPEQVRRTMALMVDDLRASFSSIDAMRTALKKFVDEQMQPGDLVAIIRTSAGSGLLQQFTADKRRLYAAIEKIKWRPDGLGKVYAFDAIKANDDAPSDSRKIGAEAKIQDDVRQYREDIFAIGTLGAINYVVRGFKDLPGRKSLVLFSDGLTIFARNQNNSRILEVVRQLTDLANRSSVVIYTIDARGQVAPGGGAEDDFSGIGNLQAETNMHAISQQLDARMQGLFDSRQGLEYLAYNTGGSFLRDANDLSRGVARVLEDQKGYYLLGYTPDESTFNTPDGRRGYHKLIVKVKRPGLTVRSRTGFYGVPDESVNATPKTPRQQIASALVSPFVSGEINLKLTSLFGHEATSGSFISSLLHISADKINFTHGADGWHKAVLDLAAVTLGSEGQLVDQEYKTYTLQAKDDLYQQILKRGFVYTINLPVKKPGAYQLRVAVRDNGSERLGAANQYIEVPDINKGRLALSSLIATGSDTKEASQLQTVPSENGDPNSQPATQASSSSRRFRQGMEVSYAFVIYNPQVNKENPQPQIESQTFLFKDGQPVYTSTPKLINLGQQANFKEILAGGNLQLGGKMPPGEYVLQIVVTDKLAKDKYATATQWIDFEVVQQ
jgi:VWFA-related protein